MPRSKKGADGGVIQAVPAPECLCDGCGFVATVNHTVGTFGVATGAAIIWPVSGFHQLFKGSGVAFIHQIAGLLPAKEVVSGAPPGSAFQVPGPLQKLNKER